MGYRVVSLTGILILSVVTSACSSKEAGPGTGSDGGGTDAGGIDAGTPDGGGLDALRSDSGPIPDAGPPVDSGMCPPPPTTIPFEDRVVSEEFTDPPMCSGCPGMFTGTGSLDVGMLPDGATTIDISGAAAGASMCEWWVIGGACGVTHGSLPVDPDGSGAFSATLPVFCGTNIIRIICGNGAGRRVLVRRIEGTACPMGGRDLRLTIAWDELGDDWELHLVQPGGRINSDTTDCTWFTCMGPDGLEWGAVGDTMDNPHKDVDDLDTFGPENIYLERAPPGTYDVFVEHWGPSGMPSTGSIDVTIREATVAHLDRTMFQTHHVWHVGRVTFPAGTFEPIDTTIDCTSMFMLTSRGCDMMLP